ncbi:BadF/BadG/BcrA/BcrD ATPase family protein [Microbacterium sp. K24]|uniref:N-acetylglucosamine kinase n=1 Tax=Microbacterium sp. K24 TaxID=2305446 RepID=UPI001443EE75|nr:BadF/BadG/BcrA/BcrD ATPase family protein [Microbacterium sp. K24]
MTEPSAVRRGSAVRRADSRDSSSAAQISSEALGAPGIHAAAIDGAGLVLGVDVGNSKTHVVVADREGRVVGVASGPGLQSGLGGLDTMLTPLIDLAERASGARSGFDAACLALAGIDLPEQEQAMTRLAAEASLAERITVLNDTFALLRTGPDRGDGVAVVAGAGINCVGVRGDVHVRYHAMGTVSGDWGGGMELGRETLSLACRAEDGRGEPTALSDAVPQHFGLERPLQVTEQIMRGELSEHRLVELARVALETATQGDAVAQTLVSRVADEVVTFVETTRRRLTWPDDQGPLPVLLGGGLLQSGNEFLLGRIREPYADGDRATISVATVPPIVGSLLLAYDLLGGDAPDAGELAGQVETALA